MLRWDGMGCSAKEKLTGAHALQHFGALIRARGGVNKVVHIGAKVVGALCRHLCGTEAMACRRHG